MADSSLNISAQTMEIRVDPEIMMEKSSAIEGKVRTLTECIGRFENKVNATSYYWIGEAGELYRSLYRESQDEMAEIIERISSLAGKLHGIAQQSSENEKEVTELAESLMDQVIF